MIDHHASQAGLSLVLWWKWKNSTHIILSIVHSTVCQLFPRFAL